MTRLLIGWLLLDVAAVVALAAGGGRPDANAHPFIRSGGESRYWPGGVSDDG